MRKIKEVLRLKFEAGLSHERIAAATGMSKGAVSKLRQARPRGGASAGRWSRRIDDSALEALLFTARRRRRLVTPRPTSPTSTRSSSAKA